jgi:hypothetical protein
MNWKRIGTGAALAALLILLLNMTVIQLTAQHIHWPTAISALIAQALVDGFFCSCLYAVVRPRLGPGPRTAVLVGSAIYLIKHGFSVFWVLAAAPSKMTVLSVLGMAWIKFMAATYLAGWQYIENAP